MIASDIISAARVMLQDTSAGADQRWTDAEMLLWIREGQPIICGLRPDSRIHPTTGVRIAVTTPATTADSLWLPEKWKSAMTNYLLHRCYLRDSEDAGNGVLAKTYWDLFMGDMTR